MKKRSFTSLLAVILCAALLISCLPFTAFAASVRTAVQMVEGDVIADFVPAGTACTSSDTSVAWVDEGGSLNAMKIGSATISDGTTNYTVTVGDYEDGSEVVGNLKLLARYNDSMQFYDGHVYLLFTSYQDGVTVTVPDLYAAYEISDQYYEDIAEDISKGSNHTGNEAYEYFSEWYDVDSVTLDRGEIVTVGMYRGFDLTVPQAALGSIRNSSAWKDIVAAGKTAAVTTVFDYLYKGEPDPQEALAALQAIITETGIDYTKLLDGTVDGGVCFNRELYNQKLEWDQYENVTYELDITRDQLDAMTTSLGGNNGRFSILKNSCATVALRAWNAAVGTRGGQRTSYYLTSEAEGIFSFIDAPKGVRDNIVKRLPGYYLNNSEGVAEPNAGYRDDTGWVYVSAPEYVAPLVTIYDDTAITLDAFASDLSNLINAAKGDRHISYNKDDQVIGVSVKYDKDGEWTTVSGVDFTINGTTVSLDNDNMPEDGVNFMYPYDDPAEGEYYYLLDPDGEELSGYLDDAGYMCVHADSFPITYKVASAPYEETPPGVGVYVGGTDDTGITTEIYYIDGGEKDDLDIDGMNFLDPGTKVFIKPCIPEDDDIHVLNEIIFGEDNVMNGDHYDSEEYAYYVIVPDEFTWLSVYYEEAAIALKGEEIVQIKVGDVLDIKEYVKLTVGLNDEGSENIAWETLYDPYGAVKIDGSKLTGKKQGGAIIKAYAAENPNLGAALMIEAYDSFDDMCAVTMSGSNAQDYQIRYSIDDNDYTLPYSGYRISKGAALTVVPTQEDSKALRSVIVNGKALKAGGSYIVEKDTQVKAEFAEAQIKGLPKSVKLESKYDTYQLNAEVRYTGLLRYLPVYDSSVTYRSSDPMIAVDENGLITVAGDIPEGGAIAYVTAYAGSSNEKASASCKVVVGDYRGERIVGSLTVSARPIVQAQLISHAMITYTAYEDTDLEVSYYEYYKPNEKFYALMQDYADHPEDYDSDPVLYSDNELGIEDRDSYFDITHAGAFSEPRPVQVRAGDSITISNYGVESSALYFILKAVEGSTLSSFSPQAQGLARSINQYMAGEEFDAPAAFDDMAATIAQIFSYTNMLGFNPADGVGDGGIMINREAYNQFRRADSQTPNQYYTVDITADELARLKAYLADPQNNYYSFMVKSCATSTVDIWNTTLADRPELCINGNFTGIAADPMSIYYEVGSLRNKSDIDGEGGDDKYPRLVGVNSSAEPLDPAEPTPVHIGAEYILGDADSDCEVTILDATAIQRYLAGIIKEEYIDLDAACISEQEVTILDATYIRRYLAGIDVDSYPISKVFEREALL